MAEGWGDDQENPLDAFLKQFQGKFRLPPRNLFFYGLGGIVLLWAMATTFRIPFRTVQQRRGISFGILNGLFRFSTRFRDDLVVKLLSLVNHLFLFLLRYQDKFDQASR